MPVKLRRIAAAMGAALALAGGAAVADAPPARAAYVWDSVAVGGGGFVTAVIPSRASPGVAYARTDVGGAYRWDPRAQRWIPLLDWVAEDQTGFLGIDGLAIDPHDANTVYLLAGIKYLNDGRTAILRSQDGGKTFETIDVGAQFKTHGNGMGRQNGERLAVDPADGRLLYLGSRRDGLFKSADSGHTWTRVTGLPVTATPNDVGINLVVPDPASVAGGRARRVFAGVSRLPSVGANLYRSDDGGATFTPVTGGPDGLMPQRAALDGAGNLVVTYANGAGPHPDREGKEPTNRGAVFKYAIAAGTWTDITPRGWTTPFAGVGVDPKNPRRLVVSTINTFLAQGDAKGDRIFTTTDGGRNWTDVIGRGFVKEAAGVPWLKGHGIHWTGSVAFDSGDGKAVWVTSGNGVFRAADIDAAPAAWTFTVAGMEETVPLGLVSIPGGPLVSAIGDIDGYLHDDPTRHGRIHAPQMGTTTGLDVAARAPRIMARLGDSMYVTRDGAATWTKTVALKGRRGQLALSADGAVILHIPERAATTWRSADGGASWTEVQGLTRANLRPVADPVDPATFYVYEAATGALLASSDGGASFARRASLPAGGALLLRAAPGRKGELWVPLKDGGLARSRDGGAHFDDVAGVRWCGALGFGKAAPGKDVPAVYIWGTVGGVRGMYRSIDDGVSWVRINDDAHQYGGPGDAQLVVGDMNRYGVVYMTTAGRGIVFGKPAIP
ncbi:exo-alpha-sialidase [Massilia sp. YIM B02763]|uniref:WD40/YVTN/BNR-like repeat-containing protein n=1 Tax=Massilia sp. YIM B02763 TaxID=3050130 RepID=UPI0025B6B35D|nr:exo-alpha-sialidase [Massilia sp. YIM B02763]MDN4051608.1 exo-alpha-sialidase [Massilia sp. YIM B02763]